MPNEEIQVFWIGSSWQDLGKEVTLDQVLSLPIIQKIVNERVRGSMRMVSRKG